MSIWFDKDITTEAINKWCENSAVDHNDIVITKVGEDFLEGTMPVSAKSVQPQRRLHGGVTCVLTETLGSIAANIILDQSKMIAFGQSIHTNHLRPAIEGALVTATARPEHLGKSSQVWTITVCDDRNRLIAKTTLTMAVVKK